MDGKHSLVQGTSKVISLSIFVTYCEFSDSAGLIGLYTAAQYANEVGNKYNQFIDKMWTDSSFREEVTELTKNLFSGTIDQVKATAFGKEIIIDISDNRLDILEILMLYLSFGMQEMVK